MRDYNRGVYYIRDKLNGEMYIGCSIHLTKRLKRHMSEMIRCKHHNILINNRVIEYGSHIFEMGILEYLEENDCQFERESFWIERLKPELNIDKFLNNHPNKVSINTKRAGFLEEARKSGLTPDVESGEGNPNWRGGISKKNKCPSCGKEKMFTSKQCKACNDSSYLGENNPFYGKSHSEETRKILSEKKKGIKTGNYKYKGLHCLDTSFTSLEDASEELKVPPSTVYWRCKSLSPRWEDWYFIPL